MKKGPNGALKKHLYLYCACSARLFAADSAPFQLSRPVHRAAPQWESLPLPCAQNITCFLN